MSLTQEPRGFASPPHDGFAFHTVAWLWGGLSTPGLRAFNRKWGVAPPHPSNSWRSRPYDRAMQVRRALIAFVVVFAVVTLIAAVSAPRDDGD